MPDLPPLPESEMDVDEKKDEKKDKYIQFFRSKPVTVWGPEIGMDNHQIDAFTAAREQGVGKHIVQSQRYAGIPNSVVRQAQANDPSGAQGR